MVSATSGSRIERLWVDMDGNVHLKGTLHGVNGSFSGELLAATGQFNGVVRASDFQDMFGRSMLVNASSGNAEAISSILTI
jgi:hypothetical protein